MAPDVCYLNGERPVYSIGYYEGRKVDETNNKYPDLDRCEAWLAAKYLAAFEKRETQPAGFEKFKSAILLKMRQLQQRFSCSTDEAGRISLVAKLINFNQIMRETSVSPAVFLPPNNPELICRERISGQAIPENLQPVLDLNNAGINFLDYTAGQIKQTLLVANLRGRVRIFNSDQQIGTAEAATRSAIIDTHDEGTGLNYPAWFLASLLVHEAAHLDYIYQAQNGCARYSLEAAESYAARIENVFLVGLKSTGRVTAPELTLLEGRIADNLEVVKRYLDSKNITYSPG